MPRYISRHSAPLVVCEVTGVKGASCSKREGVITSLENASGLMLVSPSAPVGRVIKARSLVGLYGKLTCHTTPPKWGPMYRRARIQFLETEMKKMFHSQRTTLVEEHLYYHTKKKCGRDKVCEYPATFTYMFTAECEKHPGQSSHHNGKYK